ncbi:phosphotransferase [Actinacidiphila acididurans]|uniref:Phosphotransferase n=1 Tax=Actinacidiphila acididurans TaxID=2784346 RepID=A0ABS2U433_9ACTN|nr:phosphotransferase [Actinacidiphila acididurans]MBM9510373.1 phosphotransferase [Actinacidiphila acididurans]
MRRFAEVEDLSVVVRDAVGGRVEEVERLRGGSKKGVYRVRVDGGEVAGAVVYRWAGEENYWPGAEAGDAGDPFAPASGLAPFLAAQRHLADLGVRVPRVLGVASGRGPDGRTDTAVVEDVPGGTLESLFATQPDRAAAALADLARTLGVMGEDRSSRYGRVDLLAAGGTARGTSCEQIVLDRALDDLAEAARRETRIGDAYDRMRERLLERADLVAPRTDHRLIHGELGPDHVLVDADGRAVLIDIEGLMYFDLEWEHVFLRLRFAHRYPALSRAGLDPGRLALYEPAMRLSLVAGPLRLLDGDFPDRDFMRGIVEHNLAEALVLLG